jgi:hypothetical protein
MSIELELRLEGQDANEDTLLDLKDWLGRADIEGVTVQRKELPKVDKTVMSGSGFDPTVLLLVLGTPPAILATVELINRINRAIENWHQMREKDISIDANLTNPNDELEEIKQKIQAVLENLKKKVRKDK